MSDPTPIDQLDSGPVEDERDCPQCGARIVSAPCEDCGWHPDLEREEA
jgi:hypothetical protein